MYVPTGLEDVFDSSQDEVPGNKTPKQSTKAPKRSSTVDNFDLSSSASDSSDNDDKAKQAIPRKKMTNAAKATKRKVKDHVSSSTSSASDSSDNDDKPKKTIAKKKMPRITNEERAAVCVWIQKTRSDGQMLCGRWIRNGGAKRSTMTATSGEVKTSGAYDALAT